MTASFLPAPLPAGAAVCRGRDRAPVGTVPPRGAAGRPERPQPAAAAGGAGARRRPSPAAELVVVAAVYLAYSLARQAVGEDPAEARRNALAVLDLERSIGWDVEQRAVDWLVRSSALSVAAGYAYAVLHYTVTPAVLVWLYRARPSRYRRARSVLVASTAVAMVCYWLLPTAPPRLTSEAFPDVMALTSHWGWWGGEASAPRGLGSLTNQYAAVPSMHVGWAVWCAVYVAAGTRRRAVRAAAAAYPMTITAVVVATSNHWVLDAAAGAAVVGALALAAAAIGSPGRGAPAAGRPAGGHRLPAVPAQRRSRTGQGPPGGTGAAVSSPGRPQAAAGVPRRCAVRAALGRARVLRGRGG